MITKASGLETIDTSLFIFAVLSFRLLVSDVPIGAGSLQADATNPELRIVSTGFLFPKANAE
jgi:hypothetical protein